MQPLTLCFYKMTDEHQDLERIRSIIEGDGREIREQFILAAVLLTILERLKQYVVNQVDTFFAVQLDLRDGKIQPVRGKEFKQMIKEWGEHKPGQHSKKEFRAALRWFLEQDAIDKAEFDDVERYFVKRNEIGHELMEILLDHRKEKIHLIDVLKLFAIYVKIVRWWLKEIEAATNPDITQEQYDSANWDEAESLETMLLKVIINKALAGNTEWEQIKGLWEHKTGLH